MITGNETGASAARQEEEKEQVAVYLPGQDMRFLDSRLLGQGRRRRLGNIAFPSRFSHEHGRQEYNHDRGDYKPAAHGCTAPGMII